ncbi:MAG TPA: hypothetical protein VIT92_01195 [Burkholderiaceae bacterium]
MHTIHRSLLIAVAASALAACTTPTQRAQQQIAVVNAVSWTDTVDGSRKREKSRLSLADANGKTEHYPLMQVKRCNDAGRDCVWGVARVKGAIHVKQMAEDAVEVAVAMDVDIARRQQVALPGFEMALEIPRDIPAASHQRLVTRDVRLTYGKTATIDLDYGIQLDLCVARPEKGERCTPG